MNGMAEPETGMFEIPPMSALRRPLTEAEARKWRGGDDAESRKAVAALGEILENDAELTAELARALVYRRIYEAMLAQLAGAQNGALNRLTANIREMEKSFSKVLR